MQRAVAVIDDPLGMIQRPGCVERVRAMASVSCGNSVATAQFCSERRLVDVAGEAAVAELVIAAVPARRRQPDFEADLRVCGGMSLALHAAELRKVGLRRNQLRGGDVNLG
jgi:hypothetical protein